MQLRNLLSLASLILAGMIPAGAAVAAEKPIKIGAVAPKTGPLAGFAEQGASLPRLIERARKLATPGFSPGFSPIGCVCQSFTARFCFSLVFDALGEEHEIAVPVDCIDTGFAGGFLLFLDPCAAGFSGSNPFLLPLYLSMLCQLPFLRCPLALQWWCFHCSFYLE